MLPDQIQGSNNLKIRNFSAAMEKEAIRLLEKYEHTAEKRLQKAEKHNPRSYFFSRTFLGRKITDFVIGRHYRKALVFFNQKLLDEAEKEIRLMMKWDPFFAPAWLWKAKLEFMKNQYKEAIWCATCALKLEPGFTEALVMRSQAEVELKHFASAMADLIQISERFPDREEPWLNAGLIAFQIGKMDQADLYVRHADELKPSLISKKVLVQIHHQREEFEEMEKLCREIEKMFWAELADSSADAHETVQQRESLLEKKPETNLIDDTKQYYFGLLFELMISLSQQMKMDEMHDVCKEILYFWPENVTAKYFLAQVMMEKDELDQTLELFNEILEVQPETSELHGFIGEILFKQKKYEEALPHLRIAIREGGERLDDALHSAMGCLCELGKENEIFDFCSEMIGRGIRSAELLFVRGTMFILANRIDDALADFQKAARLAPRNPDCWLALSKIYAQQNRLKEAADTAERALRIKPGMIDAGLIRIQALDILGRSEEALKTIEKLIKNVSEPVTRWILKGDFCARQNNLEESRKNYTKALKRNPKHPIALLGRARVWELEENWQKAYDDISEAIQAAPDITRLYFHRAVYAANLKNFQQAIRDCERFLAHDPDDFHAILLLGEIRLEMKKPEAAIVLFQKVLEKDPNNVPALMRCAEAKVTLSLLDSALNDVDRAIELAPQSEEARVLRLQILLKLSREAEALKYCTENLEQFPENLSLHYNRGMLLLNMGNPEEALADFEWVCEHDSEAVVPHYSRALALNALYRHEEAMEALNRVLEIQPDFILALSEKALTYSFLGDSDLSLELLDKVLEKTPEDVRLLNIRGTILANKDRIKEARDTFQKVVDIRPDYAPALNNLGHVQMLLGDWEKGLESLNLAIQSDDKWARPHLNRALIYMKIHSLEEAREDIEIAQKKAQAVGDEDVLVDAYDLGKKLEILKKFLDSDDREDSDPNEDFWSEDDPEDPDDFQDGIDMDPDTEMDGQGDSFMKGLMRFLHRENLDDSDDNSDMDWDEDEEFDWDIGLNDDSNDDWDDDSDEDWDIDLDDDDPDEEWREELDENPEDFDFLVDSDDEFANLTSDFMRIEEFLSYEVQIGPDVGKNLWPKFERMDEKETDSPGEVVSMDDESVFPVEMSLNYLDLSIEENSEEKKPVTPAQIEQGTDFLRWVFQLWNTEQSQEPPEKEEDGDSEDEDYFEFMPPIIINCPEKFQKRPDNSAETGNSEVLKGLDFTIPMASYIRYKSNRDYFFEQLMEVSDILDQALKNAETPEQKHKAMRHKRNFEFLVELIMKELGNPENEILLVFTNFLTNPIMNELSGRK